MFLDGNRYECPGIRIKIRTLKSCGRGLKRLLLYGIRFLSEGPFLYVYYCNKQQQQLPRNHCPLTECNQAAQFPSFSGCLKPQTKRASVLDPTEHQPSSQAMQMMQWGWDASMLGYTKANLGQ